MKEVLAVVLTCVVAATTWMAAPVGAKDTQVGPSVRELAARADEVRESLEPTAGADSQSGDGVADQRQVEACKGDSRALDTVRSSRSEAGSLVPPRSAGRVLAPEAGIDGHLPKGQYHDHDHALSASAPPPPACALVDLLLIPVTMDHITGPPVQWAIDHAEATFAGPASDLMAAHTFDAIAGYDVEVTPWIQMPTTVPAGADPWTGPAANQAGNGDHCPWVQDQFWDDAKAQAAALGFDVDSRLVAFYLDWQLVNQDHDAYVFPEVCKGFGVGSSSTGEVFIYGTIDATFFTHELGHVYGLPHSGRLSCVDTAGNWAVQGSAAAVDCAPMDAGYGDWFSAMGQSWNRTNLFEAPQVNVGGWLPDTVLAETMPGTTQQITLQGWSIDDTSQLKATRTSVAPGVEFWVEYRVPVGWDDWGADWPRFGEGVQIRSTQAGGLYPRLIEAPPFLQAPLEYDDAGNVTNLGTFDARAATFGVGTTFLDEASGYSVSVLAADGTNATVEITAPERAPGPVESMGLNVWDWFAPANAFTVNWTSPVVDAAHGEAETYEIEVRRVEDGALVGSQTVSTGTTGLGFESVSVPWTFPTWGTFEARIRAANSAGAGEWSALEGAYFPEVDSTLNVGAGVSATWTIDYLEGEWGQLVAEPTEWIASWKHSASECGTRSELVPTGMTFDAVGAGEHRLAAVPVYGGSPRMDGARIDTWTAAAKKTNHQTEAVASFDSDFSSVTVAWERIPAWIAFPAAVDNATDVEIVTCSLPADPSDPTSVWEAVDATTAPVGAGEATLSGLPAAPVRSVVQARSGPYRVGQPVVAEVDDDAWIPVTLIPNQVATPSSEETIPVWIDFDPAMPLDTLWWIAVDGDNSTVECTLVGDWGNVDIVDTTFGGAPGVEVEVVVPAGAAGVCAIGLIRFDGTGQTYALDLTIG